MCSVPRIEVPTVDLEFSVDDCQCHAAPIEFVEIWRPGNRHNATTRIRITDARKDAGLWMAIRDRYTAWKAEPLLLLAPPNELNVQPSLNSILNQSRL